VAEAAVAPALPSFGGVIRNALILLFGFIGLGFAAAVVAHKMDRRVYVASDVEQLLGYGPMAQLPDFDEVSDEVAEAHVLRLASGLEFACKNGQLTSCVFTGAGPGVGVTTITKRVKRVLGVLGTEAVVVDATGSAPTEHRSEMSGGLATTGTALERSSLSTSLAGHAGEGAASEREVLLLTDTAPLTVSAGAEYLARRADCTILVIESGATTRAQLRAAAESLQRMDAAAVGFVLNRVSLRNADESFRHSVSEVERHLRAQGRTTARTVAQSNRVVPETAFVSPVRETPELAEKSGARAVLASPAARPETPASADRAAVASVPLSTAAPFAVAEERETQALARAASAYSAAQSIRSAKPERVAVSQAPLQKPTLFAVVEKWEAQHLQQHAPFAPEEDQATQLLPQSAPLVPTGPDRIEPVPFSVARAKGQFLDETVALPIPERMPVITGSHEVPQPESAPMVPYEVERVAEPTAKAAQAVLPPAAAKLVDEPKEQPTQWVPVTRPAQQQAVTKPSQAPSEETPWWLSESPKHAEAETALIPQRAARVGTWHSAAANGEQNAATEKAEPEAPTRLSGLRGLLFPLGVKESGSKKDSERIDNGNGNAAVFGRAPQIEAAAVDDDQTIAIEAAKPQPIQEPVHAKAEGAVPRGEQPRWVTAEPEFLPPREEAVEKSKEPILKKTRHDEDAFDDIQILPARRGQYKR
jgi:Mrp family chromosome partitioning ATPase